MIVIGGSKAIGKVVYVGRLRMDVTVTSDEKKPDVDGQAADRSHIIRQLCQPTPASHALFEKCLV